MRCITYFFSHIYHFFHVDNASAEKYESSVLGIGVINVKEVIDMAKKMGNTTHFIIEQESYQGKKPLDSMKEDLAMMHKWGY